MPEMGKQTVGRTACLLFILTLLTTEAIGGAYENLEHVQQINDAASSQDESLEINSGEEETFIDRRQNTQRKLFGTEDDEPFGMDSLTIIWYMTTFTALLGFFVVMACTEKSCNRGRQAKPAETRTCPPTPCPSYKNFAPPSYDSVMQKQQSQRIFIVPVHDNNNFFNQPDNDVQNQTRIDIEREIPTR